MDYVVTGGAGYIGGHLVDKLVEKGNVTVLDDFSKGNYTNGKADTIKIDLRQYDKMNELNVKNGSVIFHFAANPDVKSSATDIYDHFSRDVPTTLNVMELARKKDAKMVVFASSSVVYGETKKIPTPETERSAPISNYALFKLECEEIIKYYAKNHGIRCVVLRFANIVGGRTSHGIICDFRNKLMSNKDELEILGDGKQRKSYLYINDTINAVDMIAHRKSATKYNVFNVGNSDYTTVEEIADTIEKEMGVTPKHIYKNNLDGRGWQGDVRVMLLDIKKIEKLGWKPQHNSGETVRMAIRDLISAY